MKLAAEHVDKEKKRWRDETTVALSGYNVEVQRDAMLTVLLLVELGSCTKWFLTEPEMISWAVETWTQLGVPAGQ